MQNYAMMIESVISCWLDYIIFSIEEGITIFGCNVAFAIFPTSCEVDEGIAMLYRNSVVIRSAEKTSVSLKLSIDGRCLWK